MTCHDAREQFSDWVDEALSPEDRALVAGHIESCADCRRELDRFTSTVSLLQRMERPRAPVGFVDRVLEAARPVAWPVRLARRVFVPLRVKLPAEAAALLLVAGLAVYVFQRSPELQMAARDEVARPAAVGETRSGTPMSQSPREDFSKLADRLGAAHPQELSQASESKEKTSAPQKPVEPGAPALRQHKADVETEFRAAAGSDAARSSTDEKKESQLGRSTSAPPESASQDAAAPSVAARAPASPAPATPAPPVTAPAAPAPPTPAPDAPAQVPATPPSVQSAPPPASSPAPSPPAPTPQPAPAARERKAAENVVTPAARPPAPGLADQARPDAAGKAPAETDRLQLAAKRQLPPSDVIGRLAVKDRDVAERTLVDLLARSGGTLIARREETGTTVLDVVVPNSASQSFAEELTRLGTWAPDTAAAAPLSSAAGARAESGPLVHFTLRLVQ